MDSKEEKKERRQGYFARLKRKKTGKQSAELTSAAASNKDDPLKVILGQTPEKASDEEKKKKRGQGKQLRRNEIKRHSAGELQNNKNEKKEKKMVTTKPLGTVEYIASSKDTLNTIALAFNITPNKLVEMNKLFSHMILPGQVLYVPFRETSTVKESSCGVIASTGSSDAEYDKLPDADLARTASKPIERVLSSTSEEEEASEVRFLKMNCRYITDGKGVVGGVMIVTPNNVMFDPHKSDPLVIENGCEEYGHICPMAEVVSIALYSDISHMKLKDALPSDRPKDLCPLYRPGEWEDLSSEKDINPFSKFKSMNKGKRKNGVTGVEDRKTMEADAATEPDTNKQLDNTPTVQLNVTDADIKDTERSNEIILNSNPKKSDQSPTEDDFIELVETLVQQNGNQIYDQSEGTVVSSGFADSRISNSAFTQEDLNFNETTDSVDKITIKDSIHVPLPEHKNVIDTKNIELCLSPTKEKKNSNPTDCVNSKSCESVINVSQSEASICTNSNSDKTDKSTADSLNAEKAQSKLSYASDESPDSLSPCSPEDNSKKATQMDSESELKMWLQKRMQGPIEDMLPSKEEKSKNPPMFLCVKVGKPMRKSFAAQTSATVQHDWKRKQLEYWFAVPQERVDDLYVFFLQCSPEVYGKDAKDQGFVVVDKEELDMIDNFFSDPSTKSWEIINVNEANRRKSTGSYEDDDEEEEAAAIEEFLPDLKAKSLLLEDMHIKKLAQRLPARVQGYPWHLMYSMQVHGASLKTLYRNLGSLDSPVLLVVKDMDNQVFGAYATHPFRVCDHYYGTGETFLFTFSPDFKAFKWSGDNSYFINGDTASLALGGGGSGFGLWLDSDLYHGRSNSCGTFKNDILSKKEDFVVQAMEVWTFK